MKRKYKITENYWMSISDMMSALMIIFLFVAIAFMIKVQEQQREMNEIIVEYKNIKSEIYEALYEEFKDDFKYWDAELDRETLSIKFQEPEVLFAPGSSEITPKFKAILNDFFPRYIELLSQEKYKNVIQEIRIEGHTSSEWNNQKNTPEAYFKNMELSQARTRSVLEYTVMLPQVEAARPWLIGKITANGLSYSQRVIENGVENPNKSRRVEFRIRTNADEKMSELEEKTR
ncbi:OmpA family protein [Megamonas hypermegale]|uniref:OmpA/MotB family protein n=1 Tax=Megamonas hypermegale TaxID=158847 RepID=UPI0026EAD517|nr:OmpA family protein [Megamonas hypermegale]